MVEKINISEFEKIAFIARIKMDESELDIINGIKEKILDRILEIDIDPQTPEERRAEVVAPYTVLLREDVPVPSLTRGEVLANAGKNTEAGCISVPKILEQGE